MFPSKKSKGESNSVQRFLDVKKDGPSRVKHVKLALDGLASVHDRRGLLEQYSFEIFHLFHELIETAQLAQPSSSSNRYSGTEIECALWTLEQVLTYLPHLIAQKWQYNAIGNALKQCLHPHNGIPLRKIALRLFLLWYQTLGAVDAAVAKDLDGIFAVLVPHLPLPNNHNSLNILQHLCQQIGTHRSLSPEAKTVLHSLLPSATNAQSTQGSSNTSSGTVCGKNRPLAPSLTAAAAASQAQTNVGVGEKAGVSGVGAQTASTVAGPGHELQNFMEKLLDCIAKDCTRLEWYSARKAELHRKGLRFLIDKLREHYIRLCWPDLDECGINLASSKLSLPEGKTASNRPPLRVRDPLIVCRFCLVRWISTYAFSHRNLGDSLNKTNSVPQQGNSATSEGMGTPRGMSSPERPQKFPSSYLPIRETLFADDDNINLTLSILKEGLLLPFQCQAVMNRVIKTLREWIFQHVVPVFMTEEYSKRVGVREGGTRTLVEILCWFYYNPYLDSENEKTDKTTVFQMNYKILGTLKDLASPQRPPFISLGMDTWLDLLSCLLHVVRHVVPTSPKASEEGLSFSRSVARHLFQTLLITWVLASAVCKLPIPPQLWTELTYILAERTDRVELVEEWSKVLETTTRALGLNFYGIDLMNAPLDKKPKPRTKFESPQVATDSPGGTPLIIQSSSSDSVLSPRELYNFCQATPSGQRSSGPGEMSGSINLAAQRTSMVTLESDRSALPHGPDVLRPKSALILSGPTELEDECPVGTPDTNTHLHPVPTEEEKADYSSEGDHSTPNPDGVSVDSASVSSADFSMLAEEKERTEKSSLFEDRDSLTPSPVSHFSHALHDDSLDISGEVMNAEGMESELTPRDSADGDAKENGSDGGLAWAVTWRRILGCIGDLNEIRDPLMHKSAIEALSSMSEMLLKIRSNMGVSVDNQSTPPPPTFLPPYLYVAPTLLQALHRPERFREGRAEALMSLSRIFLKPQESPLPLAWLSQFYWFAHRFFCEEVDEEAKERLLSVLCPRLLVADVPGSLLLVQDALHTAQHLLLLQRCPVRASVSALRFLSALAAFPASSGEEISTLGGYENNDVQVVKGMTELRKEAVETLILAVTVSSSLSQEALSLALNGLATFLLNQVATRKFNQTDDPGFQKALSAFLQHLQNNDSKISMQICESLGPILDTFLTTTQLSSRNSAALPQLTSLIVDALGNELNLRMENPEEESVELPVTQSLLLTLVECHVKGTSLLNDADNDSLNSIPPLISHCGAIIDPPDTFRSCLKSGIGSLVNVSHQFPLPEFSFAQSGSHESESSFISDNNAICVSASKQQCVWSVSADSANGTDSDEKNEQNVSYILMRNLSGKHCWKVSSWSGSKEGQPTLQGTSPLNQWLLWRATRESKTSTADTTRTTQPHSAETENSDEKAMDPENDESLLQSGDTFQRFLHHLAESSPECVPRPSDFRNDVSPLPHKTDIETAIHSLNLTPCKPDAVMTGCELNSPPRVVKSGTRNGQASEGSLKHELRNKTSGLSAWRGLLGDLSIVTWENQAVFKDLTEDLNRLKMEVKHLDNLVTREAFKIAIIYVGPGQEDKKTILSNSIGSPLFEQFVGRLGWEVDLNTHPGYTGGLSQGTAPYYANSSTELVFHVSTRLSHLDSHQNMRHLGNDEVHVVWSEHSRDYRRAIIPTQFCDVLIVIYPLGKSLFRIQVDCKDPEIITGLGPLFHGALLSWTTLAPLVRATALNANRKKRRCQEGWRPVWEMRSKTLMEVEEKLGRPTTFATLLGHVYGGKELPKTQNPNKLLQRNDSVSV